jgi:hypothetical protein
MLVKIHGGALLFRCMKRVGCAQVVDQIRA